MSIAMKRGRDGVWRAPRRRWSFWRFMAGRRWDRWSPAQQLLYCFALPFIVAGTFIVGFLATLAALGLMGVI